MSVLLLLIPVSVALAAFFVTMCIKAIKQGQFDDMESPAWRMLFDPPRTKPADKGISETPAMRTTP
jgi:cbb3-type cytochrome oxidase maturation protein